VKLDFLKSFTDFSDGANSDASTFSIKESELALLDENDQILTKNVRVDPLGPIRGRLGTALLNNAAGYDVAGAGVINFPIKLLHRYYRQDQAHKIVMCANTRCFYVTTSDFVNPVNIPPQGGAATDPAFANTLNQTDVNVLWQAITLKDWVYMASPLSLPRRTDGAFVYYVGEPPTAVTTGPSGGAGTVPAGTYYYVLTRVYRDGLGESPVSAEFSFVLGAPGSINHTLPALERADQTGWNLYRSFVNQPPDAAGFHGPYFLVNAIPLPPGVFNDALLEGGLGSRVDTTRLQPFASATIEEHQERVFLARVTENLASPQRFYVDVQFSDSNRPDQFPAEFRLRCPNPGGEPITGMKSFQGVLYIFTMNNIFAVLGTGQERGARVLIPDYRMIRLAHGPGAMSQRVIQELNGIIYFANKRDIWALANNQLRPITEYRTRRFLRRTLDPAIATLAVGAITTNQYRVTYPKRGGTGLPELTLIYDVQANAFIPDDGYTAQSYTFMDGEADDNELLLTPAENKSLLLRADSGNTDYSAALAGVQSIRRVFRTKDFSFGRDEGDWCSHQFLELEGATTDATVQVTIHLDRDRASLLVSTFQFTPAGANWDEVRWDEFDWASGGLFTKPISLPQAAKSERLAVEVEQFEAENPFDIERLTLGGQYSGPRKTAGGS